MREAVDCEITPTEIGKRCPSWFWMTDSDYFIDLGNVKLFEHSKEVLEKYPSTPRFFNYQYARFLEDLFHELPKIASPIPADLYAYINTEDKLCSLYTTLFDLDWWDNEKSKKIQYAIEDNVSENLVSNGSFINMPPNMSGQFFHVNDEVILRYEARGRDDEDDVSWWTAINGEYRLKYQTFIDEVEDLLHRFFARMDRQVEGVVKNFTPTEVEHSNIVVEHEERRKYFYGILDSVKQGKYESLIDWDQVRSDLICVLKNSSR